MTYEDFIQKKSQLGGDFGFEPLWMPDFLFPFQRSLVEWSLRKGRAAIFADCGLGKTAMQLVWANNVVMKTGKPVLILAPLAVAQQTVAESVRFGMPIKISYERGGIDFENQIVVANYEMLHHFNAESFGGVVLDESSILKSFMGKTKRMILDAFEPTDYKLACTATPAPNDHMELGNHAEFLGVMRSSEMLSRFFINDAAHVGKYRVKGHAEDYFWEWVSTWGMMMRVPSDLGFDSTGYELKPRKHHWHVVDSVRVADGFLFQLPAASLSERISARRNSIEERVALAAKIANSNDEQWMIWCGLNSESDALEKEIKGAVAVAGSDPPDFKTNSMCGFAKGDVRCLVSKPTICGFGMNFQNCHNIIFVGLSDSWEQYYQAIRRCWRFGQTNEVNVHIITASAEAAIASNIIRKEAEADLMFSKLTKEAGNILRRGLVKSNQFKQKYNPQNTITLPKFL